jgi:hypothetical protein
MEDVYEKARRLTEERRRRGDSEEDIQRDLEAVMQLAVEAGILEPAGTGPDGKMVYKSLIYGQRVQ